MERSNTDLFLAKLKQSTNWNNDYDYSEVDYINSKIKIKITCNEHGIFEQTPNKILGGRGCPNCRKNIKLTTETFIIKANKVHNNKYDYSLVNYINSTKKIKIVCNEHGIFEQTPAAHISGQGCRKCSDRNNGDRSKKTKEIFIEEAKLKHGNTYDYSKVDYQGTTTKVKIICLLHGVFEQIPIDHIKGRGCSKCSGKNLTNNERITLFNRKHNNKYDYSKMNYINAHTKICIICPKHGEFSQLPSHHLNGSGCQKCGGVAKLNNSEFIIKAKAMHGNKYDYSQVEYVNMKTKVKIVCPIHGLFIQAANNHLNGSNCPDCNLESKFLTKDEFINKSKEIHGEKYDYSDVEYINYKSKVKIFCITHGEFEQTPETHIKGGGCHICSGFIKEFLSYEEAKEFIVKLGFKSQQEWFDYVKSGDKPDNIPANPSFYYNKIKKDK